MQLVENDAATESRALEAYRNARDAQLQRNDARRIRSRVKEARDNAVDAGGRWPFELLQNACDAGPRPGADGITIRFGWTEEGGIKRIFFEHDAQPFASHDLAALLSGGSSKEFESETTTGRFGTGFLVTHVLSHRVVLRGIWQLESGLHGFDLALDRSGDEEEILANTRDSEVALGRASVIANIDGVPSARFEWVVDDFDAYERGVAALERSAAYVFGTSPMLSRLELRRPTGAVAEWTAAAEQIEGTERAVIARRRLSTRVAGTSAETHEVVRVGAAGSLATSASFLLRVANGRRAFVDVPPELPKVFRQFPVRGHATLSINAVIDGPFDVDQERRLISFTDENKERVVDALSAIAFAVEWMRAGDVAHSHRIVRVAPPTHVSESDRQWWLDPLRGAAQRLAEMRLVETATGPMAALPPGNGERWADFPVPSLTAEGTTPDVPLPLVLSLMQRITTCDPPTEDLAEDWTEIALGWSALGLDVRLVALGDLADDARDDAHTVSDLTKKMRSGASAIAWLADLCHAVGCAWDHAPADTNVFAGLLPNQEGSLCDPIRVERDDAIPDDLKTLAHDAGIRVRAELLDTQLVAAAKDPLRSKATNVLHKTVPRIRRKQDVVDACIRALDVVALGKKLDDAGLRVARLGVRMLEFLWNDGGIDAAAAAARVPLLTTSGQCDRATASKKMMLPPQCWRPRAREYVAAWPPGRVLDDAFAAAPLPEALTAWDMAHADPIVVARASELDGERLTGMLIEGSADGAVVRDQPFTSIALLQPEVLNRCQENAEHAKLLLGFVVDCLARDDAAWRQTRKVPARRGGADIELEIRDALWLGDLRTRAWVPTADAKVRATKDTLRELVEPSWLHDNQAGIELLTSCFGFDALDLQLLGLAMDAERVREVRAQLAKIVEATEGRVDVLKSMMDTLEARRLQEVRVGALRDYGLAVQAAVERALTKRKLKVRVVDRGFDFAVALDTPLEDLSIGSFKVDEWLVEVKATVADEVALTPLQARTAAKNPERFVLCVVRLDAIPDARVGVDALMASVEKKARMVSDIGPDAGTTTSLVDKALKCTIEIRNEQTLRYAVRDKRWRAGVDIDAWVASIAAQLPKRK